MHGQAHKSMWNHLPNRTKNRSGKLSLVVALLFLSIPQHVIADGPNLRYVPSIEKCLFHPQTNGEDSIYSCLEGVTDVCREQEEYYVDERCLFQVRVTAEKVFRDWAETEGLSTNQLDSAVKEAGPTCSVEAKEATDSMSHPAARIQARRIWFQGCLFDAEVQSIGEQIRSHYSGRN